MDPVLDNDVQTPLTPPLPRQKEQIRFFLAYVSDNFKTKKIFIKKFLKKSSKESSIQ